MRRERMQEALHGEKSIPPVKPEIKNAVSVETVQGYKSFNLIHGDITLVPTDLLVISTHGHPAFPPTGQVIDSLRKRYGTTIDATRRWLDFAEGCWTCFQQQPEPATFSAILTVCLRQQDQLLFFDQAMRGVFASIAALEYMEHNYPVISLPVLYGQRLMTEHDRGAEQYPLLAESLIRNALRWLKKSEHTHTIQFVVYENDALPGWDDAMNKTMGRSLVSAGADAVLKSLCHETRLLAKTIADERLTAAAVRLSRELAHPDRLVIDNICVSGRMLVETMAKYLLADWKINIAPSLLENIETIRKTERTAPWIVSYMHSLRIFGNETAHARDANPGYRPSRLEKGDLVSALSAIRSLLTVWPIMAEPSLPADPS